MATTPTRLLHSGRRPRLAAEATTHRRMTRNAATALPLAASGSTAARRAKPSQATTNPTANPPTLPHPCWCGTRPRMPPRAAPSSATCWRSSPSSCPSPTTSAAKTARRQPESRLLRMSSPHRELPPVRVLRLGRQSCYRPVAPGLPESNVTKDPSGRFRPNYLSCPARAQAAARPLPPPSSLAHTSPPLPHVVPRSRRIAPPTRSGCRGTGTKSAWTGEAAGS